MYELDSVCAAVISSDTSKGFVENSNTEFCSDCERVSGITFFGITYRPYALLTICSTSISFPVLFWSKLLLGNPFGKFQAGFSRLMRRSSRVSSSIGITIKQSGLLRRRQDHLKSYPVFLLCHARPALSGQGVSFCSMLSKNSIGTFR